MLLLISGRRLLLLYSKTTTPLTALKQPPPPFPNSCPSLNLQLIFYSFFPLFWLPLELNITVGSTTLIDKTRLNVGVLLGFVFVQILLVTTKARGSSAVRLHCPGSVALMKLLFKRWNRSPAHLP